MDKLAQLRASSCAELPTPELAVLTRTTMRLRRSGIAESCLRVGETVPDFSFIDADNKSSNLYKILAQAPVVVNFFRGYWCRYCKTEFEAYQYIQPELQRLGSYYLAISPQKPVKQTTGQDHYQMIFDKDNQIAKKFGIVYELEQDEINLFKGWGLELDKVNESARWALPLPATYIIRQDRTIGFEFVDVDFRCRCCPDNLLAELKEMYLP